MEQQFLQGYLKYTHNFSGMIPLLDVNKETGGKTKDNFTNREMRHILLYVSGTQGTEPKKAEIV